MSDPAPGAAPEATRIDLGAATPMLRQYLEVKARHPDALLLFRLGDFYELFFEDAKVAAEALEITLTSRPKGEERIPMCGVPYHAARGYIARLVEKGFKVAVCDQMEEPQAGKGIVRREVTRVITPGTVLDEESLEPRENNFLAALVPSAEVGEGGALASLDASTGELRVALLDEDGALADELGRVAPRELLMPRAHAGDARVELLLQRASAPAPDHRDDGEFDPRRGEELLREHFGVATLAGFGLEDPLGIAAAAAALRYLRDTALQKARHVDRVQVYQPRQHLALDASTRANLEVFASQATGKKPGSLLGVLDRTLTAMGGRKLHRWLAYPLVDPGAIARRQDAVEELFASGVLREDLGALLRGVHDLERLSGRLASGAGNARDMKALGDSLALLPRVAAFLEEREAAALRALAPRLLGLEDAAALIAGAITDDPPPLLKEGGMIRRGHSAELDALWDLSTHGKDAIARVEADERARTGISSLKVRFNRVFGYYIEVTRPNLDRVPADYVRRQTTAGGERFITPPLQELEEKVLTAEEKRVALEQRLFEELREKIAARAPALRDAADAVAEADTLCAFARAAAEHGYARPVVDESDRTEIVDGRHPVVEQFLRGEAFVPNDVALDCHERQLLIVTGPNMAGKSTVLRQVALITLMAQAGSFVPARKARIGVCDRIFTRVGASDDLARGRSTFMVEMTETAAILNSATRRSLIVLDEIGRGTSTFDGLSIAWAVAEHIHDRVGARTLFATHYHELCELTKEKARAVNVTVAVKEWEGRVIFLRKLVPGAASRSYGIEVARLAGLPPELLHRAREILAGLEHAELDAEGRPRFARKPRRGPATPESQLGLFGAGQKPEEKSILDELRALQPDAMAPLEALQLLAAWKKKLT